MVFDKKIVVSGVTMKLRPYTERRLRDLVEINKEIQEFIDANREKPVTEIADQRAQWYKRKAEVLWEPEVALSLDFFKSEDFEVSLLKDTEDFFLRSGLYL